MTVEPIEQDKGVSRAKAVCDDCGKCSDSYHCGYDKGKPIESQIIEKVKRHGWALVKGKLRCMTCEAKRKVAPMKKPEPPREPTRKQRIQIFTMLAEVYDVDAEQYMQGDTDETVANVLGVMPGWVANIREAEFGPAGGNENIQEMQAKIDAFERDMPAIIKAAAQVTTTAEKKLAEVSVMKVDLAAIQKAVGPRVLTKAGVK